MRIGASCADLLKSSHCTYTGPTLGQRGRGACGRDWARARSHGGRSSMGTRGIVYLVEGFGVTLFLALFMAGFETSQLAAETANPQNNDLEGAVTSTNGAEAGVWVIAETTDLPTRFVKIVVTDEQGRYVLPDLPQANYSVWVRGYGLVDSPKVQAMPGQALNLTAVVAPDAHAAAQYYPAGYWFSMLRPPDKSEFPGTGDSGNGIST